MVVTNNIYLYFTTIYVAVCCVYEIIDYVGLTYDLLFSALDPISNFMFVISILNHFLIDLTYMQSYASMWVVMILLHKFVFNTFTLSVIQYTVLFLTFFIYLSINKIKTPFMGMTILLFCLNWLRVIQLQLKLMWKCRTNDRIPMYITYNKQKNASADSSHWFLQIGDKYSLELRKYNSQPGSKTTIVKDHKGKAISLRMVDKIYIPYNNYGIVGTTLKNDSDIESICKEILIKFERYAATNKSCQEFCNKLAGALSDSDHLDCSSDLKSTIFTIMFPVLVSFTIYLNTMGVDFFSF